MSKRGKDAKGAADSAAAAAATAPAAAAAPPDPALEAARASVEEWSARVDACMRAMEGSQATLRALGQRNERNQRELQVLRADANLVAALRMDELAAVRAARATGAVGGPPRGRGSTADTNGSRSGSAGSKRSGSGGKSRRSMSTSKGPRTLSSSSPMAPECGGSGNRSGSCTSGDPAAAALDEKKRKLQNMILSFFRSNPAPGTVEAHAAPSSAASDRHSVDSGARGEPAMELAASVGQPVPTDAGAGAARVAGSQSAPRRSPANTGSLIGGASGNTTGGACGEAADHRRPRDVPAAAWEEIITLRAARVAADERVAAASAASASELARFTVLQEQVAVARYGLRSAIDAFLKAGGLAEDVPGAAGGLGSAPGSRAVSRGRGSVGPPSRVSGR